MFKIFLYKSWNHEQKYYFFLSKSSSIFGANIHNTLGLNFRWSWQLFVRIFWWRAPPKGGRGHPLTMHHYTKVHLCSIIPWPIRREEYETLQIILGILGHQRAPSCRLSGCNNLKMWLAQHGCLRTELSSFVANSECHLDPVCHQAKSKKAFNGLKISCGFVKKNAFCSGIQWQEEKNSYIYVEKMAYSFIFVTSLSMVRRLHHCNSL